MEIRIASTTLLEFSIAIEHGPLSLMIPHLPGEGLQILSELHAARLLLLLLASSRSQWALPDINLDRQMSEIEWHKDRMSECMSDRISVGDHSKKVIYRLFSLNGDFPGRKLLVYQRIAMDTIEGIAEG